MKCEDDKNTRTKINSLQEATSTFTLKLIAKCTSNLLGSIVQLGISVEKPLSILYRFSFDNNDVLASKLCYYIAVNVNVDD